MKLHRNVKLHRIVGLFIELSKNCMKLSRNVVEIDEHTVKLCEVVKNYVKNCSST